MSNLTNLKTSSLMYSIRFDSKQEVFFVTSILLIRVLNNWKKEKKLSKYFSSILQFTFLLKNNSTKLVFSFI